jgi:hypothetical protein
VFVQMRWERPFLKVRRDVGVENERLHRQPCAYPGPISRAR